MCVSGVGGALEEPHPAITERGHGQGGVDMLNSWVTSALRGVTFAF